MNKYAAEFEKALSDSALRPKDLARDLRIDASNITHWRKGTRSVPWQRAEAVALRLSTLPEKISPEYDRLSRQAGKRPEFAASESPGPGASDDLDDRSLVRFRYLPSHMDPGAPHTIDLPRQLFAHNAALLGPDVMVAINNTDAMKGKLERDSLIFIDTSVKEITREAIYAYLWVKRPMIKFIQIIGVNEYRLKGTDRMDVIEVTDAKSAKALEPQGIFLAQLALTTSV